MKWTDKGHQFDEIGKLFEHTDKIYIYGAGELGTKLYHSIHFLNCFGGFVDTSKIKQENGYLGEKVFSPDEFLKFAKNNLVVIVAASVENTAAIMKRLLVAGFKEGINCFSFNRFMEFYLPIVAAYRFDKVYLHQCCGLITEKCNLSCEKCVNSFPYMTEAKHYPLDSLIKNIQEFFSKVDFVLEWGFGGGEPFLYPNLAEFIIYLGEHYYLKNIGSFLINTNGTIIPSDMVLRALKKYNVHIIVSDYSKSIPTLENKVKQFITKLEQFAICYKTLPSDGHWVDMGYTTVNKTEVSEREMTDFFEYCGNPCREFKDGKLYYCIQARTSEYAFFNKSDSSNTFDFAECDSDYKKVLLEFNLGFTKTGYVKMCRKCNGMPTINKNYIEIAKQLTGADIYKIRNANRENQS